ncbi:MAG: DUF4043 family protein [Methylobacteriaceae bacterium]|jgi:N4-gp56 family major capsid protein|nr:DUF4043 family protein [Methylobacteriaceae bacterium]
MANIELAAPNRKKVWTAKRYDEYVRASGFKPFMGRDDNKVIHLRYELRNERGDQINIPLFARLRGEPKRGAQVIEGNEQGMANYHFPISIDWVGEGVAVSNADQFRTEIDLLEAGRAGLVSFMGAVTRNDIIDALNSKGGKKFGDATPAELNAWLAANGDRVLFGSNPGSMTQNFAAGVALLTADNDKLTAEIVRRARFSARNSTGRLIRPAVVEERAGMSGTGGALVECFVMFVGARSFYHLKHDPTLKEDLRHAMERGASNPLFQPDDLMIDNVVVREIPEISERCLIGGTPDVEPYFFCGAQAVGYAIGQDPKFTTGERDYGYIRSVAVRELRGIAKTLFNGVDHGLVTGYVAAPSL